MCKKTILTLTVLALASVTAFAASKDGVVLSQDGRTAFVNSTSKKSTPYVREDAGLTVIFDNLGTRDPDGVYWCCGGFDIFGPDNTINGGGVYPEYWEAAGFTPSTSLSVTKIQVAVGWYNYTTGEYTDVLVSLNEDNGGVPGAPLKTWKTQIGGIAFGSCCAVSTDNDAGIPVTAGKQYWVVVSTEKKSNVWAIWNQNDTQQLSTQAVPESFWCSGTASQCGSGNNTWESVTSSPSSAFAVFGK